MTTKSVQASGGDYATWALWEAGCPADITAAGTSETWIGEGADETFSEADVEIGSGITTDATYYMEMRAQSGTAFNGVAGNGPVIDEATGTSTTGGYGIKISAAYTRVTNIEVTNSQTINTGNSSIWHAITIHASTATETRIQRCIIHDIDASDNANVAIAHDNDETADGNYYFLNNVIYEVGTAATYKGRGITPGWWDSSMVCHIIGNSLYNADHNVGYGVYLSFPNTGTPTANVYNNLVIGATEDYNVDGVNPVSFINGSHNGSGDLTASDAGTNEQESLVAATEWLVVTAGSENLHLATSGTTSKGAGSDRTTTPSGVELDIDGYDRDAGAVTWDIGADQEGLPAGTTPDPWRSSMLNFGVGRHLTLPSGQDSSVLQAERQHFMGLPSSPLALDAAATTTIIPLIMHHRKQLVGV